MTKSPLALHAADVTAFTRVLAQQLGDDSPSHLKLMNMVARSAGFQNLQHMRAVQAAASRLTPKDPPHAADHRLIERCLHQFDDRGRLRQWPAKRAVQTLALWGLWAALPAKTAMTERQINAELNVLHCFGDPATLRRTMISCGLLKRSTDCSDYMRVEQKPPVEALAVMEQLGPRRLAD